MKKFWICFFCFLFFVSTGFATTQIQHMTLSRNTSQKTRLVVEMDNKTEIGVFRLKNPARLVVDFKQCAFSSRLDKTHLQPAPFVDGVRLGSPNSTTCRVVLDTPQNTLEENHFLLPPTANKKWRFVLDLMMPASVGIQPFTSQKTASPKIVILDPGHGGADPGAISGSGKYEKDLTLLFANELKKVLENKNYQVFLTRSTDTAVSLRGRIEKAHKHKGDLFISIHADSAKNKQAKGLSIYTISEKASDIEAAALAERENKADIILGLDLQEYQENIGNILIDLAKRDTMDKSATYAELMVQEVKKTAKLKATPHRFAGFVVLKSPNIPSVLLELGYLSNKNEEKLLQKKAYRKDIATAMARAVDSYFSTLGE